MKIGTEIAKIILGLIPGLHVTSFEIKNEGMTCVSQQHFSIKPYKSLLGEIDEMQGMNYKISKMMEYLKELVSSLNDSEGKPFIYAIKSTEEGRMQICVNMRIFNEFDKEDKLNELKSWLIKLNKFWMERSKLHSNDPSYKRGVFEYIAESKAQECLDVLAKLNSEVRLHSKEDILASKSASKDMNSTSFFSFFSNMNNKNKLYLTATSIGVVGGTIAFISYMKNK